MHAQCALFRLIETQLATRFRVQWISFAFEFSYPVPGKRMVCFVIEHNGKTNHKFSVIGIRKGIL